MSKIRALLAPLDPVHDVGLKMIRRELEAKGHSCILMPPDIQPNEVVRAAMENEVDVVLVSRTIGYEAAEALSRLVDLADAAGLRKKAKFIVGGMGIRPELAAELGFDAGFGPGTRPAEVVAYLEGGVAAEVKQVGRRKSVSDILGNHAYHVPSAEVRGILDRIVGEILQWAEDKTTPGIRRAAIRERLMTLEESGLAGSTEYLELEAEYVGLADESVRAFYRDGIPLRGTRLLSPEEVRAAVLWAEQVKNRTREIEPPFMGSPAPRPAVFIQFGTGCPIADIASIKAAEAWGADGAIHFDPTWGARSEGFVRGPVAHEGDGSLITVDNIRLIARSLNPGTLFMVRAHRGLNTPEIVVIGGQCGAHLTKINPVYGSLGAGTDPERLLVDAVEAMKLAARYGLPFDIPTNDELCGVPAYKSFAGMLIVAWLGHTLGAKPILNPLICHSPDTMIRGQMDRNFVDYNVAKIRALRSFIDAPIWAGEPVGFMTHTEDRVQSACTTAQHAALLAELGVEAVTIASADEAFAHGPITIASRVDTLRALRTALRFMGETQTVPTPDCDRYQRELEDKIAETLERVAKFATFVDALKGGALGDRDDGVYPGRAGAGTVSARQR